MTGDPFDIACECGHVASDHMNTSGRCLAVESLSSPMSVCDCQRFHALPESESSREQLEERKAASLLRQKARIEQAIQYRIQEAIYTLEGHGYTVTAPDPVTLSRQGTDQ